MSTIPVKLLAQNCPYAFTGMGINDFLGLIPQFISAEIDLADVSFFLQGTVDPSTDVGIFYNQSQQVFKAWDTGTGRYLPVGLSVQAGDMKQTFIGGDEPAQGWIVLDGRLLTAVSGISQNQFNVLQILFGTSTSATLPNWTVIGAFTGLPAINSFNNIGIATFQPPNGQVAGLGFSNPPQQSEVQALATNTEQCVDSASALQNSVTQIQALCEQLIDALNQTNSNNGSGTPAYVKLYVGPP